MFVLLASALPVTFGAVEEGHLLANRSYSGVARPAVCRVATDKRSVALTFDDGPSSRFTPQVLRLLQDSGERASFFLVGRNAAGNSGLVEAEASAGMEIGNHTWSHLALPATSLAQAEGEFLRTSALLRRLGVRVSIARPPFGLASPEDLAAIRAIGLEPIHWSLAVEHYLADIPPTAAARKILHRLRPGDIILAHDAGADRSRTLSTLRRLLPMVANRGWRVVTVSKLLSLGQPVLAKPRTWFWQTGFYCP
jgi:peptidoglycan/xylan/chitin deacetylase (PgdA/CDA1 family)